MLQCAVLSSCGNPDRYRNLSARNATSMARRFRNLSGLSFLLTSELEALKHAQDGALDGLQELRGECADPSPDLVEQAAHCGRWVLTGILASDAST